MKKFRYLLISCVLFSSCDGPKQEAGSTQSSASGHSSASGSEDHAATEQRASKEARRKALKKATGLPTANERNAEIAKMVWDSLESDPQAAQEAFEQLIPGSEEKNYLIEHMARRAAEKDTKAAIAWAGTLGTGEERSLAYGNVAIVMADAEPENAAKLLSDHSSEGRSTNIAIVKVAQTWAGIAPEEAARWASRFDSTEARVAGLKGITTIWMMTDPESALSWISNNDASVRDAANLGYAEAVLAQPPVIQDEMLKSASSEMKSRVDQLREESEAAKKRAEADPTLEE